MRLNQLALISLAALTSYGVQAQNGSVSIEDRDDLTDQQKLDEYKQLTEKAGKYAFMEDGIDASCRTAQTDEYIAFVCPKQISVYSKQGTLAEIKASLNKISALESDPPMRGIIASQPGEDEAFFLFDSKGSVYRLFKSPETGQFTVVLEVESLASQAKLLEQVVASQLDYTLQELTNFATQTKPDGSKYGFAQATYTQGVQSLHFFEQTSPTEFTLTKPLTGYSADKMSVVYTDGSLFIGYSDNRSIRKFFIKQSNAAEGAEVVDFVEQVLESQSTHNANLALCPGGLLLAVDPSFVDPIPVGPGAVPDVVGNLKLYKQNSLEIVGEIDGTFMPGPNVLLTDWIRCSYDSPQEEADRVITIVAAHLDAPNASDYSIDLLKVYTSEDSSAIESYKHHFEVIDSTAVKPRLDSLSFVNGQFAYTKADGNLSMPKICSNSQYYDDEANTCNACESKFVTIYALQTQCMTCELLSQEVTTDSSIVDWTRDEICLKKVEDVVKTVIVDVEGEGEVTPEVPSAPINFLETYYNFILAAVILAFLIGCGFLTGCLVKYRIKNKNKKNKDEKEKGGKNDKDGKESSGKKKDKKDADKEKGKGKDKGSDKEKGKDKEKNKEKKQGDKVNIQIDDDEESKHVDSHTQQHLAQDYTNDASHNQSPNEHPSIRKKNMEQQEPEDNFERGPGAPAGLEEDFGLPDPNDDGFGYNQPQMRSHQDEEQVAENRRKSAKIRGASGFRANDDDGEHGHGNNSQQFESGGSDQEDPQEVAGDQEDPIGDDDEHFPSSRDSSR